MSKKLFLCATDLSASSYNAIQWTFDQAEKCNAQVAILFCYRLISSSEESELVMDLKRSMEKDASNKFQLFEKENIKGSVVSYQFFLEVGFFSSRIEAFIRRSPVNLLVLGSGVIQSFNEYKSMSFEQFVRNFHAPVVIVPEGLKNRTD